MAHLSRTALRIATQPSRRSFSSSFALRSATPDWQALVGGRAGAERKRVLYEDKYKRAVEEKAKREGVTVEEMRKTIVDQAQLEGKAKRDELAAKLEARIASEEAAMPKEVGTIAKTSATKSSKQSTPVKVHSEPLIVLSIAHTLCVQPLEDILDLSKVATLTTSDISTVWTTYHQSKGFLSAAIPTDIYNRMLKVAQKYPLFVLPLARDIIGDLPEGVEKGAKGAVEMHFLVLRTSPSCDVAILTSHDQEWAFLPPPPNISEPVPAPSTVLFTPLAEYKSRAAFAQPYLILSHYTDLSLSHNVVLMRGEISDNVALNAVDAQVLTVRLQLFYNPSGAGGAVERERGEMLAKFHEKPEEFDLDKLVQTAWEL